MSSINLFPTFYYSQPEEYHFSHDSVFLARFVFEKLKDKNLSPLHFLDLCSGSGIIGLDLLFHLAKEGCPLPQHFDFLEVQTIYQEHFLKNQNQLQSEFPTCRSVNIRALWQNYEHLLTEQLSYDLIVCNPPYFFPEQGTLSPSEFKNRCRFFLDSNLEKLIQAIETSLAPQGQAFVLLKSLKQNGFDTLAECKKYIGKRNIEVLTQIRGTDVVLIY